MWVGSEKKMRRFFEGFSYVCFFFLGFDTLFGIFFIRMLLKFYKELIIRGMRGEF